MKRRHRSGRSCSGYTLVELLIGGLLFAGMLMVAGLATDRCFSMFRQMQASEEVSSSVHRLLQRVAGQFSFCRAASLTPAPTPPLGASSLSYQECTGVAGGVVQWGPTCSLAWQLDTGEVDDGQDNNGNGLVDEGQIVWTENPGAAGERSVVWAHAVAEFQPGETFDGTDEDGDGLVDERGLSFSLAGDLLTIQLALQGVGPDHRRFTKVCETSVLLRN